jgi:hypothetical protein
VGFHGSAAVIMVKPRAIREAFADCGDGAGPWRGLQLKRLTRYDTVNV